MMLLLVLEDLELSIQTFLILQGWSILFRQTCHNRAHIGRIEMGPPGPKQRKWAPKGPKWAPNYLEMGPEWARIGPK